MKNIRNSGLEERLAKLHGTSPITNDEELMAALRKIIDETSPENEADVIMLDEAVELLMVLENADGAQVEMLSRAWGEKYLEKLSVKHSRKRIN